MATKKKQAFNITKLAGLAGGVWSAPQIDRLLDMVNITDPKMKAGAKVFAGEFLPKQKFIKDIVKNDVITSSVGDGISAMGLAQIMKEFGLAEDVLGADDMEDFDEKFDLSVVIEGLDDTEEDLYGDDDDEGDDLDTVNEDVLGALDDLDTVNEDDYDDEEDDLY